MKSTWSSSLKTKYFKGAVFKSFINLYRTLCNYISQRSSPWNVQTGWIINCYICLYIYKLFEIIQNCSRGRASRALTSGASVLKSSNLYQVLFITMKLDEERVFLRRENVSAIYTAVFSMAWKNKKNHIHLIIESKLIFWQPCVRSLMAFSFMALTLQILFFTNWL